MRNASSQPARMGKKGVMEQGKALVLASGGLDSTTLLAYVIQKHGVENVQALSIQYGQKHAREMESAQMVAAHYGVDVKPSAAT